jgi:hypothetical protein
VCARCGVGILIEGYNSIPINDFHRSGMPVNRRFCLTEIYHFVRLKCCDILGRGEEYVVSSFIPFQLSGVGRYHQ